MRDPFSKSPFWTIGVTTEQVDGFVMVAVVAVVVVMVVGGRGPVRMQEQALLSLDAGEEVVAGRSGFSVEVVRVVL